MDEASNKRQSTQLLNLAVRAFLQIVKAVIQGKILTYLDKRGFQACEDREREELSKILYKQLCRRATSVTQYMDQSTVDSLLDALIDEQHKGLVAYNFSRPSMVSPAYASVGPKAIQGSLSITNSSLLQNGSSSSHRNLPSEQHRVVANFTAGSGGKAVHCPGSLPGRNIPHSVPVISTHRQVGFPDGASVKPPGQYIGCQNSCALQNHCDRRNSSISRMPSFGNHDKSKSGGGPADSTTNAVQAIVESAAPDPSSSNGSSHLAPEPQYPQVTKSFFPLMDTHTPCSEHYFLSQSNGRKRKFQPSSLPNKQFDQLQQPVMADNTNLPPQGLTRTCVDTRAETESMRLDANRYTISSREKHAKFCEAEVEDPEFSCQVQPVSSNEIVAQCQQERRQVQTEAGKLEVMCKSSASAVHVKLTGTDRGKQRVKSLSLIDSFTRENLREHIQSLRKGVGQSDAETESNQGLDHLTDDNNKCSLCRMEELIFEPPLRYCGSCDRKISQKGVYYSMASADTAANEGDAQSFFCKACFKKHGESIKIGERAIAKANLEKREDYAETDAETESWVQCDKCNAWQHQICALFNGKKNKAEDAEYTCPDCLLEEIESGVRKLLPHSAALAAKKLPTTMLSDHIEQWLFKRLKEERQERANTLGEKFDEVPGAEDLVVRVVSSVDKKVQVKQHFFEIFQEEKYPPEFPYKSKAILLFQTIEGADVFLFGMYVQEFGSECAFPNQRSVYISYIDSVNYFRPEIKTLAGEALRTFVYHEILVGYLDYCKKRGFTCCYLWSCRSSRQNDYIIYRHPRTQKIPPSIKLRKWYKTLIQKATKEKIVVEHTKLYDHFFKPTSDRKAKITAAHLPYFEGDYWHEKAEEHLQQSDGVRHEKKGKKIKGIKHERNLRAARCHALRGNQENIQLMDKIGEEISQIKEDLLMIHLQHTCRHCTMPILSGNRWVCNVRESYNLCEKCYYTERNLEKDRHTVSATKKHIYRKVEVENIPADTKDEDGMIQSDFFDTRTQFLSLCERNHYQFDTIRRAKHSTMMILYHLHNPAAPAFMSSCAVCHNDIDTARWWYCKTCPDYVLCVSCYQGEGGVQHDHDLVHHTPMAEGDLLLNRRTLLEENVQAMLDVLLHASKCHAPSCTTPFCVKLKGLFHHCGECKIRAIGGCKRCERIWYVLKSHALSCQEVECRVPCCKDLKDRMRQQRTLLDSQRRDEVWQRIKRQRPDSPWSGD